MDSLPETEQYSNNKTLSNGVASDSENDGFLSGEEDEPTRPIFVPPLPSPPPQPPQQLPQQVHSPRPVAKVTDDDDDDDVNVEEDNSNGVVLEQGGGGVIQDEDDNSGEASKEPEFSDTHEVFVEASPGDDDDEQGFRGGGGDSADVELRDSKDEEVSKEHNSSDSVTLESPNEDKVEPVVDGGGVKLTSEGDSLIDTVQVNLLDPGVAVVGDKVDVDKSEIQGLEPPPPGASLDNGFEPIEQGGEDVLDKVAAEVDSEPGQNVDIDVYDDAEQKSDIRPPKESESSEIALLKEGESSEIDVPKESGSSEIDVPKEGGSSEIARPEEIESSRFADESLKAEQDEINVEGDVVEEETGNHIEASGEDDVEVIDRGDREIDDLVFGGSDADKKLLEDLERHLGAGKILRDERTDDGQVVTESDEEEETDDEGDGKEHFDTATLAALLKAASGADPDGGSITITSQDGSRLFSVERPAGLGSSLQSGKPAMRPNRPSLFTPSFGRASANSDSNLTEEEKNKLEKLQQIRIKFLRLVQRLGFTPDESIALQVLHRLALTAGRQTGQVFSLEAAKESAAQLEAERKDDLDYSISILVLGKTGVGKSATINSIFGETKTSFSAYGPATTAVSEIVGMVDGVKIRVLDTPGLKSSAFEQSFNRKVLSTVKKLTKKSPPDIVLYVDRLDLQTRDLNDLPMLRSITSALGPSIWRNVIVTLTHAASAPPDGPSGAPLSYDVFVAQRSHIVQQTIGQAVGDLRLMNPNLMNPVSLVENHPSCRKNRDGQKVLPNGQSWRPLLLLLCHSMKILSEASNLSKTQESFDHRRLFGFRTRSPPLPYLLSWLLQSRTHPKLPDQGGADGGDSDVEMADLSDSDLDEDEDEYDQLPPFKPLKKSQIAMLNREQRKAYLEEYDYRVKLLQKKQWREELRRMREMKKGKTKESDLGYPEEDDQENGSPAAVPVPLPDMALPPSFDSDNPAYRYRFLEPTSQLLTRPVLDSHGWDHDCGYDGVNLEQSLAIINQFPAAVTVQITKDKKDFSLHLDSSIAAKHGDNGSTMAGFDIQNIGKQLAYIVRGETKFKNLKRNKTAAGVSVTFLGENVSTGLKVEDQIALGKRLVLVGSTGTVRSQGDSAYGANLEVRLREADFPIGQDQSSLSLSLVKWRGDLALGANLQSQFSIGRSYKMAVRAGLNNKLSGQISVRTSSSDQLQIALIAILPVARAIYKNFWPGASESYSIY